MTRTIFLAVTQYIVYVLVGLAYPVMIGAYFSVAAGFGMLAILFLALPILIGGYLPGLSFFYPRLSASLAIVCVSPFFCNRNLFPDRQNSGIRTVLLDNAGCDRDFCLGDLPFME